MILNNTGKPQRWAVIHVTPASLAGVKSGSVISTGLPVDCRVVRADYEPLMDRFVMVLESKNFPEIGNGSFAPVIRGIEFVEPSLKFLSDVEAAFSVETKIGDRSVVYMAPTVEGVIALRSAAERKQ